MGFPFIDLFALDSGSFFCIASFLLFFIPLFIAAYRAFQSGDRAGFEKKSRRVCPVCDTPIRQVMGRCLACGWNPQSSPDARLRTITNNVIGKLWVDGKIPKQTAESVQDAVQSFASRSAAEVPKLYPVARSIDSQEFSQTEPADAEASELANPRATTDGQNSEDTRQETTRETTLRRPTVDRNAVAQKAEPDAPPWDDFEEPIETPKIRKSFGELISAFVHEKNIRWGEIVGGLLIISCSIALVISFWQQINSIPLLKFGLFTGVTASLFGVGLHASHHWKLPTTSQGILIISMLLVPLNILGLAALTQVESLSWLAILGEIVSIVVFAALAYFANRVLTPSFPILTTTLVLALGCIHLVTRRFVDESGQPDSSFLWISSVIALISGGALYILRNQRLPPSNSLRQYLKGTEEGWKLLGLTSFAAILAIGFLIARSNLDRELHALSPVLGLLAVSPFGFGIVYAKQASQLQIRPLAIGATIVALLSGCIVASGVALAIPTPAYLVICSLVLCGFLIITALRWNAPQFAAAAVWLIAFSVLLVGEVFVGQLDPWQMDGRQFLAQLQSPRTGYWLSLFAVTILVLIYLDRGKRIQSDWAKPIHRSLLGLLCIGALLIVSLGLGRHSHWVSVSIAMALHCVSFYVYSVVTRNRLARFFASIALILFAIQFIHFGVAYESDLYFRHFTTCLVVAWAHCIVNFAESMRVLYTRGSMLNLRASPFLEVSVLATLASSFTAIAACFARPENLPPVWLFLIVALWLLNGIFSENVLAFAIGKFLLFLTIGYALHLNLVAPDTYATTWCGWTDGTHWLTQIAALVIVSNLWRALQWGIESSHVQRLSQSSMGLSSIVQTCKTLLKSSNRFFASTRLSIPSIALFLLMFLGTLPRLFIELNGEQFIPITNWQSLSTAPHSIELTWAILLFLLALTIGTLIYYRASRLSGVLSMNLATLAYVVCHSLFAESHQTAGLRWLVAMNWGLVTIGAFAFTSLARSRADSFSSDTDQHRSSVSPPKVKFLTFLQQLPLGRSVSDANAFSSGLVVQSFLFAMLPLVVTLWVYRVANPLSGKSEFVDLLVEGLVVGGLAALVHCIFLRKNNRAGTIYQVLALLVVPPAIPFFFNTVSLPSDLLPVSSQPSSWASQLVGPSSWTLPLLIFAAFGLIAGHRRDLRPFIGLAAGLLVTAGLMFFVSDFSASDPTALVVDRPVLSMCFFVVAGVLAVFGSLGALETQPTNRGALTLRNVFAVHSQLGGYFFTIGCIYAMLTVIGYRIVDARFMWIVTGVVATVSLIESLRMRTRSFNSAVLLGMLGVASATFCTLSSRLGWTYGQMFAAFCVLPWTAIVGFYLAIAIRSGRTPIAIGFAKPYRFGSRGFQFHLSPRDQQNWASLFILLFAGLALWGGGRSNSSSSYVLLAAGVIAICHGWLGYRFRTLFLALGFSLIATYSLWRPNFAGVDWGRDWVWIAIGNLSIFSVLLVAIRLSWQGNATLPIYRRNIILAPRLLLPVSTFAALFMSFEVSLGASVYYTMLHQGLVFLSALALVVGWIALLWDRDFRLQPIGIYVSGLVLIAGSRIGAEAFWVNCIVLSIYGLGVISLWRYLPCRDFLRRKRLLPSHIFQQEFMVSASKQLDICVIGVAVATMLFAFASQFESTPFSLRAAVSHSILAQAFAIGILTRHRAEISDWIASHVLRVISLIGIGFSLGCALWSYLPSSEILLYDRVALLSIAMTFLFLILLAVSYRRWVTHPNWNRAVHSAMVAAVLAAAGLAILGIGIDANRFFAGGSEGHWISIAGIALALLCLGGGSILAAVYVRFDPYGLTEKRAVLYVYIAQIAGLILFLHLRLAVPWIFLGPWRQFWPLLVIIGSYVAVGCSLWIAKLLTTPAYDGNQRIGVLQAPLEQLGATLPIVSILGYWLIPPQINFATVLFFASLSFGALTIARQKLGYAALTATTLLSAFWFILFDSSIDFTKHPQIWLVPPAMCGLVAVQLNRKILTTTQQTTLRYICSLIIYVSSTAEILIAGVGEAPWLPFVLGGLSIAGILAGIAFQIRAFLWLGLSFLFVSMLTVIWYAAVDLEQTWIWYVTGVCAGIAILAVFALFEKYRNAILAWIESLKNWES